MLPDRAGAKAPHRIFNYKEDFLRWFYSSLTNGDVPKGLWQWNTATHSLQRFSHTQDVGRIASDTIFSIQNDLKGQLWVSTAQGLSLFHAASQTFTNYAPQPDAVNSRKTIYQWREDKQGNFWCQPDFSLLYFNTKLNHSTVINMI